MANMTQLTGLSKLHLELRQRIYEGLFSEGEVLQIPEPERKTIAAAVYSSKSMGGELAAWRAGRKELISIKKKYTRCMFTVSPSSHPAAPASLEDWPHIKDIEIVIDDLSLEKSYQAHWAKDRGLVERQVAEMRSDLKSFIAWICERNTPLTSVRVRFTQDEEEGSVLGQRMPMIKRVAGVPNDIQDWATVMAHLINPLTKLPSCAKTVVEQTRFALDRLRWDDEGLELVIDLRSDFEIGYRFALERWLKLSAWDRERYAFEEIQEDLAYIEFDEQFP